MTSSSVNSSFRSFKYYRSSNDLTTNYKLVFVSTPSVRLHKAVLNNYKAL